MKRRLALVLALLPALALADGKSGQDSARDAVMRGEILSLAVLLPRIEAEFDGRVLDVELEREDGILVYEMDILTRDGRLIEAEVDGRTGAVLDIDEKDRKKRKNN